MVRTQKTHDGGVSALDRVHGWWASRSRAASGFNSSPEPKIIGHYARGRQLMAGNFLFDGELVEQAGGNLWDVAERLESGTARAHGFTWLDDLAAVGDARARAMAQHWFGDWVARFGRGRGPGWTPDLTGRRLLRIITHALFLMRGRDKAFCDTYYQSATAQAVYLSRRWKAARPGLPRFEALCGLIHAGLSLQGLEDMTAPAIKALAHDCKTQVGPDGSIPSRNPEELLDILSILTWIEQALRENDRPVPETLLAAIARIAPTLRALRHADGGLARFHGGGRGLEGWLDQALASSGVKSRPETELYMGYARAMAGRTSVMMDAAPPPMGPLALNAHASTLALEVTSGRRPLIVNCGSGARFGHDWRQAGRATPSHSTLTLDGRSSARFGEGSEALTDAPRDVKSDISALSDGVRLAASHDGYRASHGLTHVRTVDVSADGRGLAVEDLLTILDPPDEPRFDAALDRQKLQGIAYAIRLHLHPEVTASVDLGGAAISLTLKSGEIWVLRHDGAEKMGLEPSVYLEAGRLRPRATQQVVLSGRAMSYSTRVRWSLTKAHETPIAVRDVDEGMARPMADAD